MFNGNFFSARMFAPRYFPRPGDDAPEPEPEAPQIFGSVPVQANYRRLLDLMREDEEIVIL